MNISVGFSSGSYALLSEGGHTISDIITSLISYFGFKIGNKPANDKYPLGYGRAEAISGLIIVMFLVIVAYEIISGAFEILFFDASFNPPSYLAAVMAIIGIIINLLMSQYIINLGKKINSPALVADGHHQRVDIFSSVAVLVGVLISKLGYPWLDPIIGLFIGIMIIRTAYKIGVENINNIMGKVPSSDIADEIKEVASSIEGIYDVNDIVINYTGPYATVSLNIDLNPKLTFIEAHDISNKVQDKIINEVSIIRNVTVHYSPLDLYDK